MAMLDADDMVELLHRVSCDHDIEAMDTIISANYGLLIYSVKKYIGLKYFKTEFWNDCCVEAWMGFRRAIVSFDPAGGASLSTYASFAMNYAVLNFCQRYHKIRIKNKVVSRYRFSEMWNMVNSHYRSSDFASSVMARNPRESTEKMERDELVYKIIGVLSGRERTILRLRFIEKMTLDQIGKRHKITKERVRQIEAKGLGKLHKAMNGITIDDWTEAGEPFYKSAFKEPLSFRG